MTEPITRMELFNIISDKISISLDLFALKLEGGERSDSERKQFERDLANAVADAIYEAAARGVK